MVFSFKPIILWTDALIAVLLLAGLVYGWTVFKHEHLRAPWKRVIRHSSGLVSMIVLAVFLAIGLFDTLHFRPVLETPKNGQRVYAVEVLSLLDWMVGRLRQHTEKTYSAPLATHLFSKETVELPDGRQVRTFPRLVYGGAHLKNPDQDQEGDIAKQGVFGLVLALGLWCLTVIVFIGILARRREIGWSSGLKGLFRGQEEIPWNAALWTLLGLFLLAGPTAVLSLKYHVFGTDKVGQDVLYLALKSIRTGLVIGTLTTLVMLPFAVLLGIMAGYFQGWI
ncbi:MAG: ABC transporter permease, partial [Deltaproteobacteria bacterium]|nr:ABC transporter permease [Deltaproteobacteria bacterium]